MMAHKMHTKFAKSWFLELVTLDIHHSLGFDKKNFDFGLGLSLYSGSMGHCRICGCCITSLELVPSTKSISGG